jgi:cell wall-associated NlpC family hydrolase
MLGCCKLAWLPIRKEPLSSSEMVSCLVYGETYSVLSTQDNGWLAIQTTTDSYQGFISSDQFFLHKENNKPYAIVSSLIYHPASTLLPPFLPMGAIITFEESQALPSASYKILPVLQPNVLSLIASAQRFLNTPYLWGGRSFAGIDCSGLMQIIFALEGILLPRDSRPQYEQCNIKVDNDIKEGDLLFFSKSKDKPISHVGLYCGDNKIIHASGWVKVDSFFPDKGIVRNNEITHHFVGGGRMF